MITSGGNRNPAKLDLGAGAARRRGISPAFLSRPSVNATEPAELLGAFADANQRNPLTVLDEWAYDVPLPRQ
jgi:hypothetical protein